MVRHIVRLLVHYWWRQHPSSRQQQILANLAVGYSLKSHRQLDGAKFYCLHNQNGANIASVPAHDVERLRALGLIASNLKFPASTFLLTDKGLELAVRLARTPATPLTSQRFDL